MSDTKKNAKPTHTAYSVRDRGEGQKGYWTRIGSAWQHLDGKGNITLDAVPVDGRITLRTVQETVASTDEA